MMINAGEDVKRTLTKGPLFQLLQSLITVFIKFPKDTTESSSLKYINTTQG